MENGKGAYQIPQSSTLTGVLLLVCSAFLLWNEAERHSLCLVGAQVESPEILLNWFPAELAMDERDSEDVDGVRAGLSRLPGDSAPRLSGESGREENADAGYDVERSSSSRSKSYRE